MTEPEPDDAEAILKYDGPWKRRGRFEPRIMETLRPVVRPLIGRVFCFEYAGTSGDDEPYPGQTRWVVSRQHDAELEPEQRCWWLPAEDIVFEP